MKTSILFLLLAAAAPAVVCAQKSVALPGGSALLQVPDDFEVRTKGGTVLIVDTEIEKSHLTFTETLASADISLSEFASRTKKQIAAFAGNDSGLQTEVLTDEEVGSVNGLPCYRLEINVTDRRNRGIYGVAFIYKESNRFYCLSGICHLGKETGRFREIAEEMAQTVETKQ